MLRPGQRLLFLTASVALVFSGAAALIDEHLLSKLLVRILGSSAEAVAVVLVAFMGGMGIGARLCAQRVKRVRHPLLLYAGVEIGIGVIALCLPLLLSLVAGAYAQLAQWAGTSVVLLVLRFLVAVLLVVLPGILMGATLPLILEGAQRRAGDQPIPVARFYAANTLGAAAGVFLSTYVLIRLLGIYGTLWAAFACNVSVALAMLVVHRVWPARLGPDRGVSPAKTPAPALATEGRHEARPRDPLLSLRRASIIAFGSGFLAFALEVVYFRLLATLVGNSVYAFGLMLFVFLLGNGIGSRAVTGRRLMHPLALFVAQASVGLLSLVAMPLWDDIPVLFQRVGTYAPSFVLWETTRFVASLVLLAGPTIAMGAAFALLLRISTGEHEETAERVGKLYGANMIGAIAGTICATFVLAPAIGSQSSLLLLSVAEVGLAAVVLVPAAGQRRTRLVAAALAVALASLVLASLEPWDMTRISSGSNVYFAKGFAKQDRLLYYDEDRSGAIVTVVEREGTRTLLANAKFEGNDSFEVPDQQLFAFLPLLFVRNYDAAINIGVGTACSLSVLGSFPFKHIDAVDTSPAVVHAARKYFDHLNAGILRDPRVDVHIEDGRNFLLRTKRRYDHVSIQISSIWIGGMADLYNREFYELVRSRLAPNGVFKQWIQLHHIHALDIARVVHTLRLVFPYVTLWIGGHQGVLICSNGPLVADADALSQWRADPRINALLASAGLFHPFSAFGHLYLDPAGTERFVAEVAVRNGRSLAELTSVDDHPTLEYSTPKGNLLKDALGDNMALLRRHATASPLSFVRGLDDDKRQRLFLAYVALERKLVRVARWIFMPAWQHYANDSSHAKLIETLARGRNAPWP